MAELEIRPGIGASIRVLGVIVCAAGIAALLIYLLTGGTGDFFAQRTTLTSYMPDTTGLAPTSEVRLSGIVIGKVSKVDFSGIPDPQRAVRVDMRVLKRYLKNIPSDSQTEISSDNPVGFSFLGISEGKSATPATENGELRSEPLKQAKDRADSMQVLADNLTQADRLLVQMSSPDTPVGQLVLTDTAYQLALTQIKAVTQNIHTLITQQSSLGQAFFSNRAYEQIRAMVLTTDASLAAIQRGDGASGKLFASDEQYNNAVQQLTQLRATLMDLNAGKGAGGALLQDAASYEQMRKLLAATNAALNSLNAGEGRVGELLANPQLYESLNGSVKGLEEVLKDFRQDPRKYLRIKIF